MASIQSIYIAVFGRPVDPAGLVYWNGVTNNGSDLTQIIGALSASDEFKTLYDGKTHTELVTSIYQALFGREPDEAGLEFFVSRLENGTLNAESIAISIIDGAQGDDKLVVENKLAAADVFTAHLDLQTEVEAYAGTSAADIGRSFLTPITSDTATIPTTDSTDATILTLFDPDSGQTPDDGQNPDGDTDTGGNTGGGAGTPTPTLEQRKEALIADWQEFDDDYTVYDDDVVNEAFIRLGVQYIEYLNDGGAALTEVRVHNSVPTTRDQSMHDNLLGNIRQDSIESRTFPDALELELIELVKAAGEKFLERPYESGSPPKPFSEADKWDALNGVDRPDLVQDLVKLEDGIGTDFGHVMWPNDRADLDSIEWVEQAVIGNDVIAFNVNENGDQTGFARYQGAKIRDDTGNDYDVAHGAKASFDFYIDPNWATDSVAQLTGVWVQMETPTGKVWSIVEYLDADASQDRIDNQADSNGVKPEAGFVGFRFWSSEVGFEKYVAFDGDGWVNLTFDFEDDAHIWSVDAQELYRDERPETTSASVIETLIFNSKNYGEDQTYFYDNIELVGVSVIEDFYS